MKTRILVTGGSGFIGSNLVSHLVDMDSFEIMNIDICQPSLESHLPYWQRLDILDVHALVQTVSDYRPEYVIHLAARTDLNGRSMDEYSVNHKGTSNLILACEKSGSVKKAIFASSMLVCKVGYIPLSDTDYNADTIYGLSKVEMEKRIRANILPFEWTIVRPTSIWGPGFKEPYRNFFDIVLQGRFLDIGDKYCSKTYGYIGNTVYQVLAILHNKVSNKRVYYLGDNPPIFISEWGKEIAEQAGKKAPLKIPYFLIKIGAVTGDVLKKLHFRFPMTSFRLKNMTTNNIMDLKELYDIAPAPPYTRFMGVKETIDWLNNKEKI